MPRIDRATVTPTMPRPLAPPRMAAAGTLATALLLCSPGTGLAAGRPDGGEPPARGGSHKEVASSVRPLARGAGYDTEGGATRVRQLQRALRNGAYSPGPIDGRYGPLTEGAVRRFQQAHGLPVDGIVGPQTGAALRTASLGDSRAPPIRPGAGYRSPGGSARVVELQRILTGLRYECGPLDGLFGPRTQAAVQWFQVKHGVRPTGIVDQATLRRLRALSRGSPGIDAASSKLEVPPLPDAGWRGRPIRNPHRHTSLKAPATHGRARPLRPGAGYRSTGGARRVRRVQRTLRRLGYRPGPVDGLFGPRTKAAVQWFQMKHGLRPNGTVDAVTLGHMRDKSAPGLPSRAARPPLVTTHAATGRAHDANERGAGLSPLLAILGAAFGVAILSLFALRRIDLARVRRVPPPDSPPPAKRAVRPPAKRAAPRPAERAAPASTNSHAGAGDGASPAPAPSTGKRKRSSCVVGYASSDDQAELERQAAAIERGCGKRGWTLACVIRENGPANGNGRRRPGLAHAVKQVREGLAGRVVVDSLDHLGRSEDEVRAQLEWFRGNDIDLVALDAGRNGKRKRDRQRVAP